MIGGADSRLAGAMQKTDGRFYRPFSFMRYHHCFEPSLVSVRAFDLDLSFDRWEDGTAATAVPTALAVLMASFLARQAASRTAQMNALLVRNGAIDALTAPADGAFNGRVASSLTIWQQG